MGVRRTTTGVRSKINSAITMNVYGLRNARATIHIDDFLDPYRSLRVRDPIDRGVGLLLGVLAAGHLTQWKLDIAPVSLFARAKLARMLAVNRDIMIRTAALIAVWLFFAAQGARTGDVALVLVGFGARNGRSLCKPVGALALTCGLSAVLDWPRGIVCAPLPVVAAWSINRG